MPRKGFFSIAELKNSSAMLYLSTRHLSRQLAFKTTGIQDNLHLSTQLASVWHVAWAQVNTKHLCNDIAIGTVVDKGAISVAQLAGIKATSIWNDVSCVILQDVETQTKVLCIGVIIFVLLKEILDLSLQDSHQLLRSRPWQVSVSCHMAKCQNQSWSVTGKQLLRLLTKIQKPTKVTVTP